LVLLVLLTLSAVGASTVVMWLTGRGPTASAAFDPLAVIVPVVILVAVMVTMVVTMRRIGLPFGDVVGAADRVAAGDYGVRIVERGPRFLRVVARAFNGMAATLQEQDRQRRDFLADIAHELRTPLAVLQGRLEGVADGVYPRDETTVNELLAETRMLARLVEDVGTLAHADRGVLGLRREATDVGALLHDAVRALEPESNAKRMTVALDVAQGLPLVDLDPIRIRQVLTNLLSNAIRHSADGGSLEIAGSIADGMLTVTVTDHGEGIPPEELAGIFDRFRKGRRSTGSGLGLTIARSLVEAHGGTLVAASRPGQGTTLTMMLPVRAVESAII
jgi:signal transduction histidine kinase